MNKSVFELDENIAAALAYFPPFISGFIILVMEKDNKFVRFHAMQSILMWVFLTIVGFILSLLGRIPIINILSGLAGSVVSFASLVLLVFVCFKAFKKETYKLPIIGDTAYNQVNKA